MFCLWEHVNIFFRVLNFLECGGKNFHFVHSSADPEYVAATTMRSAFEYQGQKCSACSRIFVPASLWPEIQRLMLEIVNQVKVGDVNFLFKFFFIYEFLGSRWLNFNVSCN